MSNEINIEELERLEWAATSAKNEPWNFGLGKAEVNGAEMSALWIKPDMNGGLVAPHVLAAKPTTILSLIDRLKKAEAELERERMRLAACGVVALADTPESAAKAREMRDEYRSASCDDVARRVDECMTLRAERDALAAKLKDAEHDRDEFRRVMNGFSEKMAELEGQEPALYVQSDHVRHAKCSPFLGRICQQPFDGISQIAYYARPVPAEPVNARLLDVATGKTPHLYEGRCPDYVNGPESRDPDCPACQAIVSAEAQQERLLQDMHDAGREIDRVMAESAPKEPVAEPVNTRLLTALKACRHQFAHYVAHHIGKGDMHKAMANDAMVAMADVAIMAAEAAPMVARLTHPDIAKALASAGLKPDDCREDGEILPLVVAIEAAVLRKNGIEVPE